MSSWNGYTHRYRLIFGLVLAASSTAYFAFVGLWMDESDSKTVYVYP